MKSIKNQGWFHLLAVLLCTAFLITSSLNLIFNGYSLFVLIELLACIILLSLLIKDYIKK